MKPAMALVFVAAGAVIAFRCLPQDVRNRLSARVKHRMGEGMEQMMANLPEGAPPKLVVSILPRLQAQNEQIIAMLREQNGLLRERCNTG
jgi:hypothetical protein